jgi:hypothetical protein
MRKVKARLLATLGSSFVRLANRDKYRVTIRSSEIATIEMIIIPSMVSTGMPRKDGSGATEGSGVGVDIAAPPLAISNYTGWHYNSFANYSQLP